MFKMLIENLMKEVRFIVADNGELECRAKLEFENFRAFSEYQDSDARKRKVGFLVEHS